MISVKEILKYPTGAWCVKRIAARPLMISSIARGFAQLKLKRYSILLNYYKNGEINWLTLIDDQDKINKLILNKHKKDRHYWKREFKKWLKKERKISQIFNKLRKKEIENIPDKEVIEDMMGFFKLQFESRRVSSLIDPYTFASEKILTELIRKFSENNPEVNQKEAFEILTKPESASFLNKVEIDLIKIAKEIKKDRKLAEGFKIKKIPPPILRKIKEHIEKFPWLKVESFFGAKEYTVDDVFEHIKGLLEKDLDEEERKNNMWKENKSIKKKYLLKHKFNKDIISIIELAPLFAEWQDMRKINTLMSTYIYSKYMKEISRRKGVEEDSIAYLDSSEIKPFMEGKIDISIIEKRKKEVLFVFKKNEMRVFYEDEARELINKVMPQEKEGIKELKGMSACGGKAKGIAKIVIKEEDILKVNEGDILISTMTRPEHTIAMKKAGAIVTDEGGITCHAAVISREIKKPCVIGTRIATKILKEGDYVEVDADKGIVRKLE